MTPENHDYLAREARARVEIDRQLAAAGWLVQSADRADVSAGPGVAVREFVSNVRLELNAAFGVERQAAAVRIAAS
jgi:type I restriction enzyme R subunit